VTTASSQNKQAKRNEKWKDKRHKQIIDQSTKPIAMARAKSIIEYSWKQAIFDLYATLIWFLLFDLAYLSSFRGLNASVWVKNRKFIANLMADLTSPSLLQSFCLVDLLVLCQSVLCCSLHSQIGFDWLLIIAFEQCDAISLIWLLTSVCCQEIRAPNPIANSLSDSLQQIQQQRVNNLQHSDEFELQSPLSPASPQSITSPGGTRHTKTRSRRKKRVGADESADSTTYKTSNAYQLPSSMQQTQFASYKRFNLNMPLDLPHTMPRRPLSHFINDSPLSHLGHFQAKTVGEALCGRRIRQVYSSPALRCVSFIYQTSSLWLSITVRLLLYSLHQFMLTFCKSQTYFICISSSFCVFFLFLAQSDQVQTAHNQVQALGLDKDPQFKNIRIEPALYEWLGWFDTKPKWMSVQQLKTHGLCVDID
jgi:hypothetical protein